MIHTAPAFAAAASLCCWLLGENWGDTQGENKAKAERKHQKRKKNEDCKTKKHGL